MFVHMSDLLRDSLQTMVDAPGINYFLESASLISLLLYSIWSRLGIPLKALVV
jgi:hypothetical protein